MTIYRNLRLAAVVAAFIAPLLVPESAFAASAQMVPITVFNSSGKPGATNVYAIGHFVHDDDSVGPEGYLDVQGSFREFPAAAGGTPEKTVDSGMTGPASGTSTTFQVPFGFSGRLYYSFDKKISFRTVIDIDGRNSLVQPVPWVPESADSQVDVDFDWAELSYTKWGLYLNSSQVDQLSAPASVSTTNSDGTVLRRGITTASVSTISAEVTKIPGWEHVLQTDSNVVRLINPSKLTEDGRFASDYLEDYVQAVWDKYSSGSALAVQPFALEPDKTFKGTVSGTTMTFTNPEGAVVAAFEEPSTKDVFACDGALHAPNDLVIGPIARSLCADLNRGVLGTQTKSPATNPASFYVTNMLNDGRFNYYSKIIHQNMADQRAYAFAFDDVAAQESLVHAPQPVSASIEILPETGGTAFPDGTEKTLASLATSSPAADTSR